MRSGAVSGWDKNKHQSPSRRDGWPNRATNPSRRRHIHPKIQFWLIRANAVPPDHVAPRSLRRPSAESIYPFCTGLAVKPVEGRVRHALHTGADDVAGLGLAAGRDDAVDQAQALGLSGPAVTKLQPVDGASPEGALVGLLGGGDIARLADTRLEPGSAQVEHGNFGGIEEVVAEELDGRQVADGKISGRDGERLVRVGSVLGSLQLVQG